MPSFFTCEHRDGRPWFIPTTHSRGPWDAEACHAGPPTGLLARALETLLPAHRLTRLTVELLRPVPFAGFFIDTELLRQGRTVSIGQASLCDASGKVLVVARGLHMREQAAQQHPEPAVASDQECPWDHFDDALPGAFPIRHTLHGLPAFNGDGVEVRYPPGQTPEPGATTVWMKTVELLPDEVASPFQRICPLADCGNAIARLAEPQVTGFPNTDLTILLHRDPQGDWLGSRCNAHWQANGIGMADALLFDRQGPVGRALQTLLLLPAS